MTKPESRKRIIAFRMTEDDYQNLKAASEEWGGCVSEFAREAVLRITHSSESRQSVDSQLSTLMEKLDRVMGILSH